MEVELKKKVNGDLKQFFYKISFCVDCTSDEFKTLIAHYEQLAMFYKSDYKITEKNLSEYAENYYYFCITFAKSTKTMNLSTKAIQETFINDLEIIRHLYIISHPEFEVKALPGFFE